MTEVNSADEVPTISLQCCSGAAAPAPVIVGWRHVVGLPESVRQEFWALLDRAVMAPDDPSHQERLDNFCQAHESDPASVLQALQACDFLLSSASALNLEPEVLKQDLIALSEGNTPLVDEFQKYFLATKQMLRSRLTDMTLADHGKLLTGLDWRVDNVTASDRGTQLNATVVYLTLHYREGDDHDRVSLQLTPESIKHLKTFTDRFGG
jgi:hypothetical protein